jgi:hypothetical protein
MFPIKIVFDIVQMRPACVLLQAAYGGDHSAVSCFFEASTWLLAPTEDMRLVSINSQEKLDKLVAFVSSKQETRGCPRRVRTLST